MTALSSLSSDQIATLCDVIAKLRPHGARRWDAAGIRAALAKVANLDAANVLMAAIRLSQDRTAETPGQIAITNSECWREKVSDWSPPREPETGPFCGICGRARHETTDHEFEHPARLTKLAGADASAITDELRDILAKAKETK